MAASASAVRMETGMNANSRYRGPHWLPPSFGAVSRVRSEHVNATTVRNRPPSRAPNPGITITTSVAGAALHTLAVSKVPSAAATAATAANVAPAFSAALAAAGRAFVAIAAADNARQKAVHAIGAGASQVRIVRTRSHHQSSESPDMFLATCPPTRCPK